MTATAACGAPAGREGGEPGVGVARVGGPSAVGPQLGRPRLARHRRRPGSPRRRPCPRARRRSSCRAPGARRARCTARRRRIAWWRTMPRARRHAAGGDRRRRREAIRSGVARSRSWPIAAAPTARSSCSRRAAGSCSPWPPGRGGRWLKPKASAQRTRRRAPSLAPSGAKTELHESAKEVARVPPHASSLALRSGTPESVADGLHGIAARRRRDARLQRRRRA